MAQVWDKFLTARDKGVWKASGYGINNGFGQRPALLVVDMSYGFTGDKSEPLLESIKKWHNSCGEAAWQTIPVINALTHAFRAKRLPVIYTTGSFRPDGWDMGSMLWKNRRTGVAPEHIRPNVDPNQIINKIAPQPQDIVLLKQKPSAFLGTNLLNYLVLLQCDSIVVTGTTTSGCVRATAVDAYSYNYRVIVVENAVSDRFELSHAASLFDMQVKYADVVPSVTVLEYVGSLDSNLFPNLPVVAGRSDAAR